MLNHAHENEENGSVELSCCLVVCVAQALNVAVFQPQCLCALQLKFSIDS